jgi:hypothetical protein
MEETTAQTPAASASGLRGFRPRRQTAARRLAVRLRQDASAKSTALQDLSKEEAVVIYKVYFWKKPAERRVYMSNAPLDPDRLFTLRSQGYKIYEGLVPIPDEPEEPLADAAVSVAITEVPEDPEDPLKSGMALQQCLQRSGLTPHKGHIVTASAKEVVVRWDESWRGVGTFEREMFDERLAAGIIQLLPKENK